MTSKYDTFFSRVIRQDDLNEWKCKQCIYKTPAVKHTSTGTRKFHLQEKHKKSFEELENKSDESVTSKRKAVGFSGCVPLKQLKVNDGLYRKTTDVKSQLIDKALMEMIATSNLSFNFVDSQGFHKFMKLLDPRYNLRCRNFFAQEKLPEIYEKLSNKIKGFLSKLETFSIVIDEWADEGHGHVLLGVTIHFLDDKLEPKHFVLAAEPIDGRKSAENISKILNNVFVEFQLNKKKLAYLLRDGASVVVKVARINEFESEHCLAHALQLAIKDAKKEVNGLDVVTQKIKTFIRKLRKSGVLKEAFKDAQKLEDLPIKNLQNGIDVRWNSMYIMFKSFIDNKKAIQMFCIEREMKETCTLDTKEWNLVEEIVDSLSKFYDATLFLQRRDTTISYVIPIIKAVTLDLETKQAMELGNQKFIDALLLSLDVRFSSSLTKKNLIIATLLDPRFKDKFFEPSMINCYKEWIVNELVGMSQIAPVDEVVLQSNENDDLFDSYLKAKTSIVECEAPLEVKYLIEAELMNYLHEEPISRNLSAGTYWNLNSGRFPYLKKLFCKHATAPATSSEAERLFSVAGLVLNDMRKRLDDEKIKKLLFLNCNLKLLDFTY